MSSNTRWYNEHHVAVLFKLLYIGWLEFWNQVGNYLAFETGFKVRKGTHTLSNIMNQTQHSSAAFVNNSIKQTSMALHSFSITFQYINLSSPYVQW